MKKRWAWELLTESDIESFSKDYKNFLASVKTEREAVKFIKSEAEKNRFVNIFTKEKLKKGDKVYLTFRNKFIALAVIGEKNVSEGFRLIGSHIDSPRIDIKPVPLYEGFGVAMLKTHYYGGVKKYQWTNIPLAIHGVVALKDGTVKEILIGEKEDDPVIVIPDLAPHLAKKKQGERKGFDIIKGEELHAVIGNKPLKGEKEEKDLVVKMILKILKEEYGIEEDDLISADLALVPAIKPRDLGLDRSMILAYGHDDRVCAYTSLRAILNLEEVKETAIAIFVDKEEIGSEGDAAAQSRVLEYFLATLIEKLDGGYNHSKLLRALTNARAISADVNAVINPIHKDVHDTQNAAELGKGVIITKYTGAGGKYYASEAHAEYVAWIRKILDEKNIPWQSGLLGKVDEGGGGTIAKYLANRGLLVIDMGPGVLSLHAPTEIVSKADVYSAFLAYKAFYESS